MKIFVLCLALGLGLIVAGCGDSHASSPHNETNTQAAGPSTDGAVDVHLVNWAIDMAVRKIPAGQVTFRAIHDNAHQHTTNEGGNLHDLAVAKKQADGSLTVLGQVVGLGMGQTKDLSLKLDPGTYELQCNFVEDMGKGKMLSHYIQGMHTEFRVE